jgi:hypothetical protein
MRQTGLSYRPALHAWKSSPGLLQRFTNSGSGSPGIRDRGQLGTNQRREVEIMGGEGEMLTEYRRI